MAQKDKLAKVETPAREAAEIEETIRTKDAAARYQVSKPFLYQLMARREIAYIQLGRHRRIVVKSLQAYLKRHLVESLEPTA